MKHKAWYFRVLGVIEIIGFIATLIWWFIDTIGGAYLTRGWSLWISFIMLGLILFLGPAMALLFFGHADLLDKVFPEDNVKRQKEVNEEEQEQRNLLTEDEKTSLKEEYEALYYAGVISREEMRDKINELEDK